jgi:hypothetical protein
MTSSIARAFLNWHWTSGSSRRDPTLSCDTQCSGSLLYVLGSPLALGSWWGLLGVLLMAPAIVWRLLDEERFLAQRLPGYSEYSNSVKYRLVPFIW